MGRSEKRKGLFGNEYIVHFDDTGKEIGRSENKKLLFGGEVIESYNDQGDKVSTSHAEDTFFGGKRTVTEMEGGETFITTRENSIFEGEHGVTHDSDGNIVSKTYEREGLLGNKYLETIPEQDPNVHYREFQTSLSKIDFRSVSWGATLGINSLRAFFGGFLWATFMILVGDGTAASVAPIFCVFLYLLFYVPLALFLGFLGRFFNWLKIPVINVPVTNLLWFLVIPGFIMVMIGDPILFFLQKLRPHIFPNIRYGFVHFHLILFVDK